MSVQAVEHMFQSGSFLIPGPDETEESVFLALKHYAAGARTLCLDHDPEFAKAHPLDDDYGREIARRLIALRDTK